VKGGILGEKWPVNLAESSGSRATLGIFYMTQICDEGHDGFTSTQKEDPEKSGGFSRELWYQRPARYL
jgi:hypothetical protein